jgi:hypothetical protein
VYFTKEGEEQLGKINCVGCIFYEKNLFFSFVQKIATDKIMQSTTTFANSK